MQLRSLFSIEKVVVARVAIRISLDPTDIWFLRNGKVVSFVFLAVV